MAKKSVRIAISINSLGQWAANGWSLRDGELPPDEQMIATSRAENSWADSDDLREEVYIITAEVPIPEEGVATISGEVGK